MALELYGPGVDYARQLISEGRVSNEEGQWHVVNPGTHAQDEFIAEHGLETWSLWHLAHNPDDNPGTKSAYEFPYGDYKTVAREGLLAAEERAKQYGYEEIREVALELIRLVDQQLDS